MHKKLLLLIFLLACFAGFSQTKIKVHFPGAEKKVAHIWVYTDYVSYSKKEIAEVQIDKNGDFDFKLYLNNPKPIFIQVDFIRIQLFMEPNINYEIQIDEVDFEDEELYPKAVIAYLAPNYKIIKPVEHELNKGIEETNKMYSSFIDSNYLSLVRGQGVVALVDSFDNQLNTFTESYGNKYLTGFNAFQMAQLRLMSREYSTQMVVDKYFSGDKLDLNDPKAMEFFNSFWANYLLTKGKGFTVNQVDSAINIKKSYQALSSVLANDPLLKDSVLRELVIIRNLKQLYVRREFSKSAIIDLLYDISRSKLRVEHRDIAVNVRKRLMSYDKGSKVSDYEFTDIEGNKFKLSDFEGMYIYINVWNTECPECLANMDYTKELFEDYDDVIKFISISVDADMEVMKSYVKGREFQWTIAPLGENYDFLNTYNIGFLPRYILIDKSGKIENIDAPAPSNQFSDYFLKMLNDKKGNLRIND